MSHHSDDQLLQAGSDSFWDPGNYKRTAKRIDDGYRLCQELQQLIQERAEIEKGYAKNLKAWAKKWGELIEKGKTSKHFRFQKNYVKLWFDLLLEFVGENRRRKKGFKNRFI